MFFWNKPHQKRIRMMMNLWPYYVQPISIGPTIFLTVCHGEGIQKSITDIWLQHTSISFFFSAIWFYLIIFVSVPKDASSKHNAGLQIVQPIRTVDTKSSRISLGNKKDTITHKPFSCYPDIWDHESRTFE